MSSTNSSSGLTLTTVGDFIFAYAYPMSFVGALFLCTTQFFNIQLETIFSFEFSNFLYIFIGASGFVSIFNWFNMNIPLIGESILNKNKIKINYT
jgi:hypothetical protein